MLTFLVTFFFRAKATLLDPATGKSSPERKSPSPPRKTATPAVVTENMEDESAKAASPHHEEQDIPPPPPTKDSPHTATSVDEEVVILGSQKIVQDQPTTTLSNIPEVDVKNVKLDCGKDAVSFSNLPDFKAMDFTSMMTEFLTRSSQHRVMEDNFLLTLQECYEVRLPPLPFHVFVSYICSSPQALSLSLVMSLVLYLTSLNNRPVKNFKLYSPSSRL